MPSDSARVLQPIALALRPEGAAGQFLLVALGRLFPSLPPEREALHVEARLLLEPALLDAGTPMAGWRVLTSD